MIHDVLIAGDLTGLYCGPASDSGAIWARWNLDPLLLAALAALALILARSRAGGAAVAVLVLAFVSLVIGIALYNAINTHWPVACDGTAALPSCAARILGALT